jgi:restriction system protein
MAKPSNRKRGQRAPSVLLKRGLTAIVIGASLLVVSAALSGGHPMMAALSTAMGMPAWWAIGIGLVLICAHGVVGFANRRTAQRLGAAPARAGKPPPAPATIRALIDQAEMDILAAGARG